MYTFNLITPVDDLSQLQDLQHSDLTAERRATLEALAARYGLDPKASDFQATLSNLKTGTETLGINPMPLTLGAADVWTNPDLINRLETLRLGQHLALDVGTNAGASNTFGLGNALNSIPAIWADAPVVETAFQDGYQAPHKANNPHSVLCHG